MAKFNYGLFYDFHTMSTNPDVGKNFDLETFTDQVKSCGVDFLTFHARCNQGNAYYNTEIGKRHPSLSYDLIQKLCSSCKQKGIRLSLYLNGHLSDEELLAHPEWADIPLDPAAREKRKGSPFYHQACYNRFGAHLRDMVVELLQNYEFDGFFFDCLSPSLCICPECMKEMKEREIDWNDRVAVREFGIFSCHRMCTMLHDTIRSIKPDALIYFNGRPYEEVIHLESHLECECLPTDGWGYDFLPTCAHNMRTVAGSDKTVLNMTGRFNTWGDFGGLRTAEGLEYDMFYGVANGMRPDIGGHYHPRGDLDLPVFERIREVYRNLQQYDKWVLDAVNVCDTALVYPRYRNYDYPFSEQGSVKAAVRLLDEMKIQFDLVSEFVSWEKYKLLIIPDDAVFTEEMTRRVETHIANGGAVLSTGCAGLEKDAADFRIKEWPVHYVEKISHDPLYFQPAGKFAAGLPDMPLSVYASGSKVTVAEGAEVKMYCVKPYTNSGWDGVRGNYYLPPERVTEEPFLVQKGKVAYLSGDIFAGYYKRGPKQFRILLENIFHEIYPEPVLKTSNLPSFSRAFLQTKDHFDLVHLLAYCPEKRCECTIVEDRISVLDAEVSLRLDNHKKIRKVYLAGTQTDLSFEIKDGYCHVIIPRFDGYGLVVFES